MTTTQTQVQDGSEVFVVMADFGPTGGGGSSVHNELSGRSAANAHPIAAVTDLEGVLHAIRLGYMNIMLATPDVDAAVAALTTTPDLFPAGAGYHLYVWSPWAPPADPEADPPVPAPTYKILTSQGSGLVLVDEGLVRDDGDVWFSKVQVDGTSGQISDQFRMWYVGMDRHAGAPHYIALMGRYTEATGDVTVWDRDYVVITELTENSILSLVGNADATLGTLEVLRLDSGEFSLVLPDTFVVDGEVGPEVPLGYSRLVFRPDDNGGCRWAEQDARKLLGFQRQATPPTVTVGAAAGTAASASIHPSSTDAAGSVSVTVTADGTTGELVVVETYHQQVNPLAGTMMVPIVTPLGQTIPSYYIEGRSNGFAIMTDTALPASDYAFTYLLAVVQPPPA